MNKNTRVWTSNQVFLASFLSGPLGGCYLIAKNYQALGEASYAKRAFSAGVFAMLLLPAIMFFIEVPESGFWRYLIPMSYTITLAQLSNHYQGPKLNDLRESGTKKGSYFKLILISILVLIVQLCCGIAIGSMFVE